MISSLPKPLQNDFDTIVIDTLSRYSLENKSVRRFVESVAQQIRDINRLPRFLNETKRSRNQKAQGDTNTENNISEGKERPGVLTRLQGYQSAWNRGSLVGVFLEYLKNKREDQQAKLVQQKEKTPTSSTKEKTKAEPVAQTIKSEREIVERFTDKISEIRTNTLERVVNNLQKIQEIFSSPGLLGATKNILSVYKESGLAKPITPITSSTSYTAPTYSNSPTNYSTVNTTNTTATNNESIELTQGEAQAQRQDLLKEEQVVILGGINDKGARDLKKIIASIFDEQSKLFLGPSSSTGMDEMAAESGYNGPGLLDTYLQYKGIRSLFGGKKGKNLGGGSKGAKARAQARAQGRGIQAPKGPKPGRFKMPKIPGAGLIGKVLLPLAAATEGVTNIQESFQELSQDQGLGTPQKIGVGGAALAGGAADVLTAFDPTSWFGGWGGTFGEGVSPELLNLLGAKEEGKSMGETLRERGKGLATSINEYAQQKQLEKTLNIQRGGQSLESVLLGKQKAQKQGLVLKNIKDALTEEQWGMYGTGKLGENEFKQIINNYTTKVQNPMPVQNPEVTPLPSEIKPPDIEKPYIKLISPSSSILPETTKISPSSSILPGTTKISEPTTPLTPETTKAVSPIPPSITETHITNNNADKKALSDIASNTEKTNHSLATLGDAVFKLAKVFDSKTMSGGSSVIVNSNGQAQEYTSTAQIAANNVDSTRRVRQQFLAAMS